MTCTSIARLHLAGVRSFTSQIKSPFDLSSATVTFKIKRETLCGVDTLTLNRFRKSGPTGLAFPFEMRLITTALNSNKAEEKFDDRLYFQVNVAEDPS